MSVRHIFALVVLMALHGPAGAGVDETYNRPGPSLWSTDRYARLFGRNIFQKSVAVVVGIGNYDRFPKLSAPASDAVRVRDFLRDDASFDQIITLTDEKATYDRIAELMEKVIPDALGPNDRFLFYFSGHGVTRTLTTRKRGYLVLKNAERGNWQDMIDMDRMKQWTENVAQARHSLFLLDACFSGLAAYEPKTGDVREKTIARLAQPGHYIVTAGTEGEETYIYNGESLFTQAFLSAARGEGIATSDGVVSLNEMMTRVNRTLDAKQAEIGDKIRMTPRQYQARISNNAGEFFFLPRGRAEVSIANTQAPPKIEPKTGSGAVAAIPEPTAPSVPMRSFAIRSGMIASGSASGSSSFVGSIAECEQKCAQSASCNVFTYSRGSRACNVYARADLAPNEYFDSGVRDLATSISSLPGTRTGPSPFEIRNGMAGNGSAAGTTYLVSSKGECEQKCTQSTVCNVFTYSRGTQLCYLYSRANLISNESFDSGFRR